MCFMDFDNVCLKLLEFYNISVTDSLNWPFCIEKPLMSDNLIFPKDFRSNLSFFLPHQKVSLDFNRLA